MRLEDIRQRLANGSALVVRYKKPWRPERICHGGPNGTQFCGKPGALVCTDRDGLQRFACALHCEGAHIELTDAWYARHFDAVHFGEVWL